MIPRPLCASIHIRDGVYGLRNDVVTALTVASYSGMIAERR